METATLSCLVIITVTFAVYESCTGCYHGTNERVEGIFGEDVNVTCSTYLTCDNIHWYKEAIGEDVLYSGEHVLDYSSKSYISISGITFRDAGSYKCWCYSGSSVTEIFSVTLQTMCQATVLLNGRTILYNSSLPTARLLDATEGETISIACSKNAILGTRCKITLLPASDETTPKFEVLQEHNACPIEYRLTGGDGDSCSVAFTLNVISSETNTPHSTSTSTVSFHPSVNENVLITTSTKNIPPVSTSVVIASDKPVNQSTSTIIPNWHYTTMLVVQQTENDNTVPNKSSLFPVMLLVGISFVVLGILSIVCFSIYFSRSKSHSRHKKKTLIPGTEPRDTNIFIGPTYATTIISSSRHTKDDDGSERGIPCTDDAYSEVDSVVNKESSTQQTVVKATPSVTTDYYFVVNRSSPNLEPIEHGNESDSALYTEVTNG